MLFKDKNILIIGARGGIGTAITKAFLEAECANLFITGSKQEGIDLFVKNELKDLIKSTKIHTIGLNLENNNEIYEAIKIANKKMPKIDILICNAGANHDNLAVKIKDEEWRKIIDINLNANFIINREILKIMMKNKYGRIINISSVVAFLGNIGQANYAAAKAGIIAMTKTLALESALRGVTVNCIAPGFIESKMTDKIPNNVKEILLSRIPMERCGKPEDISNAILFLASEQASYITGQTLHVNGGMFMN